jgi:hypothetical protein
MTIVEVPVPADDISTPMRNMRRWLDDRPHPSSESRVDSTIFDRSNSGDSGLIYCLTSFRYPCHQCTHPLP